MNWTGTTSGNFGSSMVFTVPVMRCTCGCMDPDKVVVPRHMVEALRNPDVFLVERHFLKELVRLTHPDLHVEGRKATATRITQRLTSALARRRT